MNFVSGTGPQIRGFAAGEDNFAVIAPRDRVTGMPGTVTVDVKDARLLENAAAPVAHEFDIVQNIPLNLPQFFTTQNLTPSVVSFDPQTLKATRLSDGAALIRFYCAKGAKTLSWPVSQTTVTSIQSASWVPGTLAASATNAVDAAIAGKTASPATQSIWSTRDDVNAVYRWNTSLWASGLDLTCLSPWNSYDANKRAGTLITPRHVMFANHFFVPPGWSIRFVKSDGTVVTRTVGAGLQIGRTDIYVAILDSDVPAGISFASVLPSNFSSYLPSLTLNSTLYRMAVAWTNQFKALNVFDCNVLYADLIDLDGVYCELPTDPVRLAFSAYDPTRFFYTTVIPGDSGSPVFAIINGKAVLLSCWHGPGGGPAYCNHVSEINAALTTLGGGYQLTFPNLSGFPTF
jgi:hypothetical protein